MSQLGAKYGIPKWIDLGMPLRYLYTQSLLLLPLRPAMVSANLKLGRGLALLKPHGMVQPSLGAAPKLAALLLASWFALPSAQANGWQGGSTGER
jgi:hypothetical protein